MTRYINYRNLRIFWQRIRQYFSLFQYNFRAIALVWSTNRTLTVILAILTLMAGLLPGVVAYIGKLIVDAVVNASQTGQTSDRAMALSYVGLEAFAVILLTGTQRSLLICQSLLRVELGQKVNVLILQKALTLDLKHFEDSEFYDKLTQARREASSRPLSLVNRTFKLVQDTLSLIAYGSLLWQFSILAVAILTLSALPAFIAETRFAKEAFRLFRWRSPETRQQTYLETLIAREDYAKEVKLYQLGPMLLKRYRDIFHQLYGEDRNLTIRRGFWGYLLGLLSTAAFYLAYAWIVLEAIGDRISLGDMTMYLIVFRQGQSTFSSALSSIGGMYEDNLYLSNLYEFLERDIAKPKGYATKGLIPNDGVRFQNVCFTYPGSSQPALNGISLHIKRGEKLAIVGQNGSGKSTLIKLLTRLYVPSSGRILLDGLDLQEWDISVLHRRIKVIFQDFVRYHFTIGENVGVGDVEQLENLERWEIAAEKAQAKSLIESMPKGFFTQLGRWFKGGTELSGGQWQKIALSRAFMRSEADILVMDEPTAAMDALAESDIFDRLSQVTLNQMVVLISHRFSTVRMADKIVVLEGGVVVEEGSHAELLQAKGLYQKLFSIQAAGYQ